MNTTCLRLALLVSILSLSAAACGRRGQPRVLYGGDGNVAGGMQVGYAPGYGPAGAPVVQNAAPAPVAPVPAPGVANFGSVQMVAGFLPDPVTVRGSAGTGQNAARLGRATSGRCRGTIAALPDFVFDVGAPFEYLRFQAAAAADTTIAVRGPQGLSCDDDGAGDRNPRVEGPFPAGRYEVWIGAANRRASGTPYELTVTTFRTDSGGAIVAPSNAANFGEMRIARGFDAQRARVRGTSGAAIDAEDLGQSLTGRCRGWIATRPDHLVTLTTAFDYLRVEAAAGQDTTLVVRGPQGLMCDDDGAGHHNPRIEGAFAPGVYQVWVGSFRRGRQAPYELLFLPAPAGSGVPAAPAATAVATAEPAPARPARPARPERPARPSRPNITVNIQAAPPPQPPPQQQVWVQAQPVQQPQQVWVQPQQPQPVYVQPQPVPQQQQSNFGTVRLASGFEPDPWGAQGTSGGEVSAQQSFGCAGWIDSRPDHILDLRSGFNYLRVEVTSNADTTLVVRGPGGVFCDDDSAGNRNPRLEGQWQGGRYEVWIGSYQEGVMSRYQIQFSELAAQNAPVASAPQAPAPPPSPDCIALSRMLTLAQLGGADGGTTGPIDTRMRLACNQGVAMGERENWPNGATLRSSGGTWYFPNGATAFSSGGTWYYANGATAMSSGGTWYFPNGATALSSGGTWYAPDGTTLGSEGAFLAWACGALGEWECNNALNGTQSMDPIDRMLVIVSLGARATR